MHTDTEKAIDLIDAGFFSSDTFHNSEDLEFIESYIWRWLKEIVEIKKSFIDDNKDSGAERNNGV
jgi:hypothetical protein